MSKALLLGIVAGLLPAVALHAADPSSGTVEVQQSWDGKVADEGLHRLKPQHGFIATKSDWRRLWKSWRPTETVPPIDFDQQFVIVGTVPGPNRLLMKAMLSNDSDLTFTEAGTKIGGPGFGYALQAIARNGIKTVNGKSLASD